MIRLRRGVLQAGLDVLGDEVRIVVEDFCRRGAYGEERQDVCHADLVSRTAGRPCTTSGSRVMRASNDMGGEYRRRVDKPNRLTPR